MASLGGHGRCLMLAVALWAALLVSALRDKGVDGHEKESQSNEKSRDLSGKTVTCIGTIGKPVFEHITNPLGRMLVLKHAHLLTSGRGGNNEAMGAAYNKAAEDLGIELRAKGVLPNKAIADLQVKWDPPSPPYARESDQVDPSGVLTTEDEAVKLFVSEDQNPESVDVEDPKTWVTAQVVAYELDTADAVIALNGGPAVAKEVRMAAKLGKSVLCVYPDDKTAVHPEFGPANKLVKEACEAMKAAGYKIFTAEVPWTPSEANLGVQEVRKQALDSMGVQFEEFAHSVSGPSPTSSTSKNIGNLLDRMTPVKLEGAESEATDAYATATATVDAYGN